MLPPQRIKSLTYLLCLATLLLLVRLDQERPILNELIAITPFVSLSLMIIYFFYRGKNWARTLVATGAVLTFLEPNQLFFAKPWLIKAAIGFDVIVAILALACVFSAEADAYFHQGAEDLAASQRRSRRILKAIVICGVVVAVLGFGVGISIKSLASRF